MKINKVASAIIAVMLSAVLLLSACNITHEKSTSDSSNSKSTSGTSGASDIKVEKVNSIIASLSGKNMRLNLRELKLSTTAPQARKTALNLLPITNEEIDDQSKIFIYEEGTITVSLKENGSVELFSPENWPSFKITSATNFTPDSSPLYLYYDFSLTGDSSGSEMRLDIHTDGDSDESPARNIFENNKSDTTKIRPEAYTGAINVTEVFGHDINIVNSIVGIISGTNIRLTFRELKLSTIAPGEEIDFDTERNLLPVTEQEIDENSRIAILDGGTMTIMLKENGTVELFSPNSRTNFSFLSAIDFVPEDSPLYLYYDFTLTGDGGDMDFMIDIHINGDTDTSPNKNIFTGNTTEAIKARTKAYSGVINVTEVFNKVTAN